MGKASRAKRNRVQAPTGSTARRSISLPWITAIVVIIIGFGFIIAISRSSDDEVGPVANQDHWHAAIGFNVCGTWAPDMPEFEVQADNANLRAGVHSHGDGLMHMHPFSSAEGGEHATVGLWMGYAGYDLDAEGFRLWTGDEYRNGDTCPDGEEGRLVWSVNGDVQTGNPANFKPNDLDVIAIGFLPEGEELGTPPSAAAVANPADLPNEFADPTTPGAVTTGPAVSESTESSVPAESDDPADPEPSDASTDGTDAADAEAGAGS